MAREPFLLVSLKEDKAKKLAQIITNESCKKILDYLSERNATESELAKNLQIPISTVHYNIQQLVEAGLVVSDEYHYSEKGKEVNHYKLANKYIIIAQKSTYGIKEKLRSILPVVLLVALATTFIQLFSKYFAKGGMTRVLTSTTETLIRETVISDKVAAPIADMGAKTLAAAPPMATEMQEAVNETVVGAINKTTERVLEPVITTTHQYLPPSIWSNIALWFLIGAVFVLVVYFTVDYIRGRKK